MTSLTTSPYTLPSADIGPENPLPHFRHRAQQNGMVISPSVPEEDRRYLGWETAYRVLPHRLQDGYSRQRSEHAFRSVVLDNGLLRATFLPDLGGRLVSLFDLTERRELLARNPVFQPANLALRNAWFAGGVEWNTSHFGHYYLTCSPVFAARAEAPDGGPALRLYEWDRVKCFAWQIDFWLPEGSRFLMSHVRLTNPHSCEIPMYWWTNIAVPESPGARVVCPAENAIHFQQGELTLAPAPVVGGRDLSYGGRAPAADELFFRIPDGQRPWIAQVDENGRGFIHTSTPRLRGRKMFVWGTSQGGQRWQEYLAREGWAYLELQGGLARTQIEHVPMPAGETWKWTEAFGPIEADASLAHGEDWTCAIREVEGRLEAAMPERAVRDAETAMKRSAVLPAVDLLAEGSGWGALEIARCSQARSRCGIPAHLSFPERTLGDDQRQWLALLRTGRMPERDPGEGPGQYMVQPEWMQQGWRALLEQSIESGDGRNWLALLHLGVMQMEAGDTEGAEVAWQESASLRPNAWALRNLAVIRRRAGRYGDALDLMRSALRAGPPVPALAIELGRTLMRAGRFDEAREFIRSLPEDVRQHERIQLQAARAALETGHLEELEGVFEREYTTIREGEVVLTEMWFDWHEKRLARELGRPVDAAIRKRVRQNFPPPRAIDFRMNPGAPAPRRKPRAAHSAMQWED